MSYVENKVLNNQDLCPQTYARYVDDCFVVVRNEQHLIELKQAMEEESGLCFTYEVGVQSKLNFLDVSVDGNGTVYTTSVYKKETNQGNYINAMSECPDRYKDGTIYGLINRAFKISSCWNTFQSEVKILKQTLINNGFENTKFDSILKRFLDRIHQESETKNNTGTVHTVFYQNQMSQNYKIEETVLKNIIKTNVKCTDPNDKIKLQIYYKNKITSEMVMANNPSKDKSDLKSTNVIYEIKCPIGNCEFQKDVKYIGLTSTTLSRRLTMHLQSGGPKNHLETDHKEKLTRDLLVKNTRILHYVNDLNRLQIREALVIQKEKPSINRQSTGVARTLHLFNN